jgi:DNA polymerase
MLVGEQPGDREDVEGRPFVGPAGALLAKALTEAGIDAAAAYVTNAVKHFSWEERGKRRIHKKPRVSEVRACRPWLDAEIAAVRPRVIVCLGATASQALLGSTFKLTTGRGRPVDVPGLTARVVAAIHPSAVLRAPDHDARDRAFASLVADLKIAVRLGEDEPRAPGPPKAQRRP